MRAGTRLRVLAPRLPRAAQGRRNSSTPAVFQEAKKRRQRTRALTIPDADEYEYLREEVAERLADRLLDITREFPVVADVGCNSGHMLKAIGSRSGIEHLDQIESCAAAASRAKAAARDVESPKVRTLVTDDVSDVLVPGTYDMIMSSMSLHWSNDLPAKMKAMARALKPDGAFLCAMLGGDTLRELRGSFVLAEQERLGGVAPHTSPLAQVSDLGNLLGQAGLKLTTVDTDILELPFADAFAVMKHVNGMGESFAGNMGRPYTDRDTFIAAAAIYQEIYGREDGTVPCTFQVVYGIGWAPDGSQPKPLERGSAEHSMTDIGYSGGSL